LEFAQFNPERFFVHLLRSRAEKLPRLNPSILWFPTLQTTVNLSELQQLHCLAKLWHQ